MFPVGGTTASAAPWYAVLGCAKFCSCEVFAGHHRPFGPRRVPSQPARSHAESRPASGWPPCPPKRLRRCFDWSGGGPTRSWCWPMPAGGRPAARRARGAFPFGCCGARRRAGSVSGWVCGMPSGCHGECLERRSPWAPAVPRRKWKAGSRRRSVWVRAPAPSTGRRCTSFSGFSPGLKVQWCTRVAAAGATKCVVGGV